MKEAVEREESDLLREPPGATSGEWLKTGERSPRRLTRRGRQAHDDISKLEGTPFGIKEWLSLKERKTQYICALVDPSILSIERAELFITAERERERARELACRE